MVEMVAQCTSTQLNPPFSFVRKRYWILCRTFAYIPLFLMRIEKTVRNITDLETCFHTIVFQVTIIYRIQKYTALIITKYLTGENFVVHDFFLLTKISSLLTDKNLHRRLTLWLIQVIGDPRNLRQSCDMAIVSFLLRFLPLS